LQSKAALFIYLLQLHAWCACVSASVYARVSLSLSLSLALCLPVRLIEMERAGRRAGAWPHSLAFSLQLGASSGAFPSPRRPETQRGSPTEAHWAASTSGKSRQSRAHVARPAIFYLAPQLSPAGWAFLPSEMAPPPRRPFGPLFGASRSPQKAPRSNRRQVSDGKLLGHAHREAAELASLSLLARCVCGRPRFGTLLGASDTHAHAHGHSRTSTCVCPSGRKSVAGGEWGRLGAWLETRRGRLGGEKKRRRKRRSIVVAGGDSRKLNSIWPTSPIELAFAAPKRGPKRAQKEGPKDIWPLLRPVG